MNKGREQNKTRFSDLALLFQLTLKILCIAVATEIIFRVD
jgi:hypothetical protein